jgi:membrane fusion protein
MAVRIIDAQSGERDVLVQEIERKTRMSEETEKELRQKIDQLQLQIRKVDEQIAGQQGFVKKVSNDYNQFAALVERHLVSLNELTSRQQAWVQAVGRLQDLQNSELRLQGELKDAQYQLSTNVHTRSDEIDTLKNKILEINEKLANSEAHSLIEIRAPEDGVVTAILAHPGQMIATGTPMLKIVPQQAPMQAELLAPNSAIGFIHKGGRVLLRYRAFPYQKFGEYWGHGGERFAYHDECTRGEKPTRCDPQRLRLPMKRSLLVTFIQVPLPFSWSVAERRPVN